MVNLSIVSQLGTAWGNPSRSVILKQEVVEIHHLGQVVISYELATCYGDSELNMDVGFSMVLRGCHSPV